MLSDTNCMLVSKNYMKKYSSLNILNAVSRTVFDPLMFICNFTITSIVFEIWIKCTAECTDKNLQ